MAAAQEDDSTVLDGDEQEQRRWLRPSQRLDLSLGERARLLRLRTSWRPRSWEVAASDQERALSATWLGRTDQCPCLQAEDLPDLQGRSSAEPGALQPAQLLSQSRALWQRGVFGEAAELAATVATTAQDRGRVAVHGAALLAEFEAQLSAGQFHEAERAAEKAASLDLRGPAAAAAQLAVARTKLARLGPEEGREALGVMPRLGLTWSEVGQLLGEADRMAEESSQGEEPDRDADACSARGSSDWSKLLRLSANAARRLAEGLFPPETRSCLLNALDSCQEQGFFWSSEVVPPFPGHALAGREALIRAAGEGSLSEASAKLAAARRELQTLFNERLRRCRGGLALGFSGGMTSEVKEAGLAAAASAQAAAELFRSLGHNEGEGACLVEAAKAHMAVDSRSGQAAGAAEAALACFQKGQGHRRGIASALQALAYAKLANDDERDLVGALAAATECLQLCEELGDRYHGAEALRTCAAAHLSSGEAEEVVKAATAARSLSQELCDCQGEVQALLLESDAWRLSRSPGGADSALVAASSAVKLLDGGSEIKAWAEFRIASAQQLKGSCEEALRTGEAVQAAFDRLGRADGQVAVVLEVIVPAFRDSRQPQRAKEAARSALEVAKRARDVLLEATALRGLASVQLHAGEVQDSLRSAKEAAALLHRDGARRAEAMTHRAMVEAFLTAGEIDHAINAEREALTLFRELRDLACEAGSLRGIAEICLGAERLAEVVEAAEKAAQLLQELRDEAAESEVLERLLFVYKLQQRYPDALRIAGRRLEMWRERHVAPQVAGSLCDMADLYISAGRIEEATEAGQTAEGIFRRLQDSQGEARVLLDIVAKVETLKGQPAMAQLAAQQAAKLSNATGNADMESKALELLASQLISAGELAEALRGLEEAAIRFRSQGHQLAESRMVASAVNAHLDSGQNAKALQAAEAALAMGRRAGKAGEAHVAKTLELVGRAHLAQGEPGHWQKALNAGRESQSLYSRLGDVSGTVSAQLLVIDAQLTGGRVLEAFQEAAKMAASCKAHGNKSDEASALFQCFRAECELARYESALAYLHQSLNLRWELGDENGSVRCLYALAQLHLSVGDYSAALEASGELLIMIRRYRRNERLEALVLELAAKAMLEQPGVHSKDMRGLPSSSVEAATLAVQAFRTGSDVVGLASALRTLAACHLQKKSPSRAASASEESSRLLREIGDSIGEVDSLLQLAVAHLEAERPSDAQTAARNASEICKSLGDNHRNSIASDLLQIAQHFDSKTRSGLWAPPGQGQAAKVASCVGGPEVRASRSAPKKVPTPTAWTSTRQVLVEDESPDAESNLKKQRWSTHVPFNRKAFPWRGGNKAGENGGEAREDSAKEESTKGQGNRSEKNTDFFQAQAAATPSAPVPTSGQGEDLLWRCGECGMTFESPDDGARTGAETNFHWFCRGCWRTWVDDHLRRARAAKLAGDKIPAAASQAGKGSGKGAARAAQTGKQPASWSVKAPVPEMSRQELMKMSLIELYKRARSTGADFKQLSTAMDSDNPKAGLLDILAPV
eukprot:TRINITY_DN88354_c0_g1_i1.p1 TRINITY_DN88354_c0_g1~~TRINITY_DN88354_c0_g1_i1.p1  ORF type:complete len:1538 (+),score=383.34 TRINITY_DN88354_c0_g1_i1:19-4632(+)